MAKTINVDVIDKSVAPKNPVNICIVNKPNPAKNCTVTESQLYRLINMPSYWVYEAGTTNIITGKNFEKYFPSSSGGASITIDSELSETSKNPVENQAITSKILPLEMSSHMHTNKDILDKFSTDENTNELLFNDTPVIITITVDSTLSETSSNPIQNKTVTQQINQLNQRIPTKTSQLSNDKKFQTKEDIDTLLTPYAKTTDIPTVPSRISSFTNDKEYQTKSDVTTILTAYTKTSDLKTKLSQFENDENYIKNTVDNLVNYYTKTEIYNKTEVDALIGNINKLTSEIVTELPTTDISTSTIYLVKKGETTTYTQWMYINGTWAELGDTTVDLGNYYTITEIDNKLLTCASLDIVNNHINDTSVHVSTNERTNWNRAVTDSHIHDNKNIIDKFTEDDNGGLLYNGEQINAESDNVWHGTRIEFEAIPVKDENVTYIVEDEDDSINDALIDDSSTSVNKTWSANKLSKAKYYTTIPLMTFTSNISSSTRKEIYWDNMLVFKAFVPDESITVTRWRYILTGVSIADGTITIGNASIQLINDKVTIGAAYPHVSTWVSEHMDALVILTSNIAFYPQMLSLQIEYVNK